MRQKVFVYEHVSAGGIAETDLDDSLRREGRAMLEAIVEDLDALEDVEPLTPPANQPPDADLSLIIAPEIDNTLERLTRDWRIRGVRALGCGLETIALASDKLRLARHLDAADVPCLPAWDVESESAFREDVVLKPRRGAGSFAISTLSAGETMTPSAVELIASPLRRGTAVSVLVACRSRTEAIALPACAQTLSNDGTFSSLAGHVPAGDSIDDDLDRRARRLALAAIATLPDPRGFVGVDLLLVSSDDANARDEVVEINPRLTTSYCGLRRLAEDNLARVLLDTFDASPLSSPRFRRDVRIEFDTHGNFCERPLSETNA